MRSNGGHSSWHEWCDYFSPLAFLGNRYSTDSWLSTGLTSNLGIVGVGERILIVASRGTDCSTRFFISEYDRKRVRRRQVSYDHAGLLLSDNEAKSLLENPAYGILHLREMLLIICGWCLLSGFLPPSPFCAFNFLDVVGCFLQSILSCLDDLGIEVRYQSKSGVKEMWMSCGVRTDPGYATQDSHFRALNIGFSAI